MHEKHPDIAYECKNSVRLDLLDLKAARSAVDQFSMLQNVGASQSVAGVIFTHNIVNQDNTTWRRLFMTSLLQFDFMNV